jgi:hypothetical protein
MTLSFRYCQTFVRWISRYCPGQIFHQNSSETWSSDLFILLSFGRCLEDASMIHIYHLLAGQRLTRIIPPLCGINSLIQSFSYILSYPRNSIDITKQLRHTIWYLLLTCKLFSWMITRSMSHFYKWSMCQWRKCYFKVFFV